VRLLLATVEVTLQVLASWTLAYHLTLLLHLPAGLTPVPFLILSITALLSSRRGRGRLLRGATARARPLIGLGLCSLAAGALTLFTSRPDNDDLSFFHRALAQLGHLDQPFQLGDTMHNLPGLPPLSPLHVTTSYEPGVALAAAALGGDPLWAYQNASAFVAAALLPVVYFLLYRHFRLSTGVAVAAAWAALGFLLLEGNLHRSFGNVALVRLWQGKTILWTLFLPLTLLAALRFLQRPSIRRFSMVAMAGICAAGLSNSGVFLVPALLFCVSLAYVVAFGLARARLVRAIVLNVAGFYCVGLAVAVASGIIPRPMDETVWTAAWPASWRENLGLVLGDSSLLRDALILVALPLAMLRRPLGRLPALLTLALCLTFANQLLGPWWMEVLKPGSYWRLAYLFPLPLCAGLMAVPASAALGARRVGVVRAAVAAAAALAMFAAYRAPVLSETAGTTFKAAGEYKFRAAELQFARRVATRVAARNVLASENMVAVLALLDPSARLEAGRSQETLHLFRNAGMAAEGERRVAAQRLVTTGVRSPDGDAALLRSLHGGVDAIILEPAAVPAVLELLGRGSARWQEVERDPHYVLLLRQT
jgi:hypothetical protein